MKQVNIKWNCMRYFNSPEKIAVKMLPNCYLKLIGAKVNEYLDDDNQDWLGRGKSHRIAHVSKLDREGNFIFNFVTFEGNVKENSCFLNVKIVDESLRFTINDKEVFVLLPTKLDDLNPVLAMAIKESS
ncbi:hypothetical protein JEQ05_14050 [Serratia liquefaciens]|uniref:hypothetical protein n=1 Tax=Serratia liquefaciens TaxID=614 RepID=UPI0018E49E49|nr:hypothetical protein [Serratia liquefaciens]MBI6162754.1 hypothetical protein [Serratia liquefaciens]